MQWRKFVRVKGKLKAFPDFYFSLQITCYFAWLFCIVFLLQYNSVTGSANIDAVEN